MLGYIIRRLGVTVIIVIGVALITFLMLHYVFPSPADQALGHKASKQAVATWDKQHGYHRPVYVQFGSYLWNALHGNFGFGYKFGQSVAALIKENIGLSAYLSGAAFFLSVIIAIPLGILQGVKRNSPLDYASTAINFTLYSMPSF